MSRINSRYVLVAGLVGSVRRLCVFASVGFGSMALVTVGMKGTLIIPPTTIEFICKGRERVTLHSPCCIVSQERHNK